MFKILVLQALYSPSDKATEFQIKDRLGADRVDGGEVLFSQQP